MRNNILTLAAILLALCNFDAVGQYKYKTATKIVELRPVIEKENIAKNLHHDEFKSNKLDLADGYTSDLYVRSENDTVCVYPNIILKLENNRSIDSIVALFEPCLEFSRATMGTYILKCLVETSDEVLSIVSSLCDVDGVLWCEPEMPIKFKSFNALYSQQYYLNNTGQNGGTAGYDINAEKAWQISKGRSGVVVAVIDHSGVDFNHEDLSDCLLQGYTIGNSTGYGAAYSTDGAHGTACAGIIGAIDNEIGIKGVAAGVSILPVKMGTDYTQQKLADAIKWAADRADILSCSWGEHGSDYNYQVVKNAFEYAIENGRNGKGCVVVASAGNDHLYGKSVAFPARMDDVIAVGAIDKNGTIWNYSCRGSSLNLVAPSGYTDNQGDVVTTDLMGSAGYSSGNYTYTFGGTSAACPQVAGVAALMLSVNPSLTAAQVKSKLQGTARNLGTAGFNNTYGHGLVDAYTAVIAAYPDFTIKGKTYLKQGTSNEYYVEGVPESLTVTWHGSSNLVALQDPQDQTHCTVSVLNNGTTNSLLTAKIYDGDKLFTSKTIPVATQFSGTYSQYACTFYGVNHPAIAQKPIYSGTAYFVHQGCLVQVKSGLFQGQKVTHQGLTPDYWFRGQKELEFKLPYLSGGIPFEILVNQTSTGHDFSLTFFTVGNNGNVTQGALDVTATGSGYELSIVDLGGEQSLDAGQTAMMMSAASPIDDIEWGLEVIDAMTNRQVLATMVRGSHYPLDTTGWAHGTYVVRAHVGTEVFTTKVLVR